MINVRETRWAIIKNGQLIDTDNIGHTRYRTKTNKHTQTTLGTQDTGRRQPNIHRQHWPHKTQDEDKQTYTDNIGHTRHRTKTNKHTQTRLGTQDTGRRQTSIHRQHWAHKTQNEDKQT